MESPIGSLLEIPRQQLVAHRLANGTALIDGQTAPIAYAVRDLRQPLRPHGEIITKQTAQFQTSGEFPFDFLALKPAGDSAQRTGSDAVQLESPLH